MNTRKITVLILVLFLMIGTVVSAQMGGGGMTKDGKGSMEGMGMEGMEKRHAQMMQVMDQMMEMEYKTMQHVEGMTKDKKAKQEMGEMIKHMDELRKQHHSMMNGDEGMKKGTPE